MINKKCRGRAGNITEILFYIFQIKKLLSTTAFGIRWTILDEISHQISAVVGIKIAFEWILNKKYLHNNLSAKIRTFFC